MNAKATPQTREETAQRGRKNFATYFYGIPDGALELLYCVRIMPCNCKQKVLDDALRTNRRVFILNGQNKEGTHNQYICLTCGTRRCVPLDGEIALMMGDAPEETNDKPNTNTEKAPPKPASSGDNGHVGAPTSVGVS